jgi:hypothetical protein
VALGVAAVAVVGAAGAGFAAGSLVGGGGTQPEEVLPASSVAFFDVDLDPAAEQKLAAARLLGRLPDVRDRYGSDPDLRQLIVGAIAGDTPLADADIDAWMGDRAGVALVPGGDSRWVTPVVALQVTDPQAAVDDLGGLVGADRVAVTQDYVIVVAGRLPVSARALLPSLRGRAEAPGSPSAADVVAAAESAPLADATEFQDAFSHLDDGIASFYVNGSAVADLAGGPSTGTPSGLADPLARGQTVGVLRAEPDAIDLVGWSSAALPGDAATAELASRLPADTVVAIEATGGAALVEQRWQQLADSGAGAAGLDRVLAEVEARLGLELPGDLQTMAGQDAVLAVSGDSLLAGLPGAGLRSVTDPQAAADLTSRLEPKLAELTGGLGIVARPTDDGMVVATTDAYATALEQDGGGLGGSARFTRALPDAADASYLAWVDVAALSGPLLLAAPDAASSLDPLDSLGATMGPKDGGTAIRVRLVFSAGSS